MDCNWTLGCRGLVRSRLVALVVVIGGSTALAFGISQTSRPALAAPSGRTPATDLLYGVSCWPTGVCAAVGEGILTSTTGGESWISDRVPAIMYSGDQKRFASVSCGSSTHCVVVGWAGTVVTTTDRGEEWELRSTPARISELAGVWCNSARSCVAVGQDVSGGPTVIRTSDSGVSWKRQSVPRNVNQLVSITCPTPGRCLATGTINNGPLILSTTDGGVTWKEDRVPLNAEFVWSVSCASSDSCVAVAGESSQGTALLTVDGGETWRSARLPYDVAGFSIACPTTNECIVAGTDVALNAGRVASTSNGGASWASRRLPTGTPPLYSVACPSVKQCVAVGGTLITTDNSGRTWEKRG
jgi:photosystem II stability/assembly factor-like uncharacterized protein